MFPDLNSCTISFSLEKKNILHSFLHQFHVLTAWLLCVSQQSNLLYHLKLVSYLYNSLWNKVEETYSVNMPIMCTLFFRNLTNINYSASTTPHWRNKNIVPRFYPQGFLIVFDTHKSRDSSEVLQSLSRRHVKRIVKSEASENISFDVFSFHSLFLNWPWPP